MLQTLKPRNQTSVSYGLCVKLGAVCAALVALGIVYLAFRCWRGQEIAAVTVSTSFIAIAVVTLIEAFTVEVSFDDQSLTLKSGWRKSRTIKWSEITGYKYSPFMEWHVFHTAQQGRVNLSRYLSGIDVLLIRGVLGHDTRLQKSDAREIGRSLALPPNPTALACLRDVEPLSVESYSNSLHLAPNLPGNLLQAVPPPMSNSIAPGATFAHRRDLMRAFLQSWLTTIQSEHRKAARITADELKTASLEQLQMAALKASDYRPAELSLVRKLLVLGSTSLALIPIMTFIIFLGCKLEAGCAPYMTSSELINYLIFEARIRIAVYLMSGLMFLGGILALFSEKVCK